jgi:hypothetical protein
MVVWVCRCKCGKETLVDAQNLLSGNTQSCGCGVIDAIVQNPGRNLQHGGYGTPTYKSWQRMRARCRDLANPRYGGRGIRVDPRWDAFENFLADMGDRPPGMDIDRIDNDGPYAPGNCRWATPKENCNNRSSNRHLDFDGRSLTISQWADELGISQTALNLRLLAGWSIERALTTPLRIVATREPDLLNQVFGRWRVIAAAPTRRTRTGRARPFWLCRCECPNGTEREVSAQSLVHGSSRSCGCLQREIVKNTMAVVGRSNRTHGQTGSPTWKSWSSMRKRCADVTNLTYGGRGIAVVPRWESFETFLDDMGERPDGMTLDRIDSDGNYEPGNCRWADKPTQTKNRRLRRNAPLITFVGRSQSVSQWAREVGLSTSTLQTRLARGWSVEKALTTPVR